MTFVRLLDVFYISSLVEQRCLRCFSFPLCFLVVVFFFLALLPFAFLLFVLSAWVCRAFRACALFVPFLSFLEGQTRSLSSSLPTPWAFGAVRFVPFQSLFSPSSFFNASSFPLVFPWCAPSFFFCFPLCRLRFSMACNDAEAAAWTKRKRDGWLEAHFTPKSACACGGRGAYTCACTCRSCRTRFPSFCLLLLTTAIFPHFSSWIVPSPPLGCVLLECVLFLVLLPSASFAAFRSSPLLRFLHAGQDAPRTGTCMFLAVKLWLLETTTISKGQPVVRHTATPPEAILMSVRE